MFSVRFAFVLAAVCACAYSDAIFPLAVKRLLRYNDIHTAVRDEVDLVASTLVESAPGLTRSRWHLQQQLTDVIYDDLGVMMEKLAVRSNTSFPANEKASWVLCCSCKSCSRHCQACGHTCCCSGSGGCSCWSCDTKTPMTFEAIKVSPTNIDDVIKVWADESKEGLTQKVKKFFSDKMAAVDVQKSAFLDEKTKLVHSVVDRVIASLA